MSYKINIKWACSDVFFYEKKYILPLLKDRGEEV
jgi:hypothetical protein